MERDERVILLLGDIGVHGFRETFAEFPNRCWNVGVSEQAMISMAAGLALAGKIPVVHTIATFLVERAFEQLKIDFGYQQLGGNFVSVGSSYDYSRLGCTHMCPGDVAILKTIPNMEIFVPGHPAEFDTLFRRHYDNSLPKYYRLSERSNSYPKIGSIVKQGTKGKVVAIGPMLGPTEAACQDLDVTLYYMVQVNHFDDCHLQGDVVVVEPFYERTLGHPREIGVPRKFLTNYGTVQEHDEACGLTASQIRKRIMEYFNL